MTEPLDYVLLLKYVLLGAAISFIYVEAGARYYCNRVLERFGRGEKGFSLEEAREKIKRLRIVPFYGKTAARIANSLFECRSDKYKRKNEDV